MKCFGRQFIFCCEQYFQHCYCDSNVLAMDKIFHFFKRAEDAILKSTKELDDKAIFGPYVHAISSGFEDEMEEMYGEDDGYSDDDR